MCVNGCTADNYRDFLMCQNHLWAAAKGEYTAPLKPELKKPPQNTNTPISGGLGAAVAMPDEENPIFWGFGR